MTSGRYDTAKVGALISAFRRGSNPAAAGELMEAFYPDLRRMAGALMNRERPQHTWQPTALVNELYLELLKTKELAVAGEAAEEEKRAFFGIAAHLMRRLLIHHARPLYRRVEKVQVDESALPVPSPGGNLLELDELLDRLGAVNPNLRTVVELRVFQGLSGDEIAGQMGCTRRTVVRYWSFASEWLRRELDHSSSA